MNDTVVLQTSVGGGGEGWWSTLEYTRVHQSTLEFTDFHRRGVLLLFLTYYLARTNH